MVGNLEWTIELCTFVYACVEWYIHHHTCFFFNLHLVLHVIYRTFGITESKTAMRNDKNG